MLPTSVSVFISYATRNAHAAKIAADRLRARGCKVFYAEENLQAGKRIESAIREQILQSHLFVLLWSADAKASDWVATEVGIAHAGNRFIIPIVLDENVPLPGIIRGVKYISARSPNALAQLDASALEFATHKQQKEAALVVAGICALFLLVLAGES